MKTNNIEWKKRLALIPINKSKNELENNIYHCPIEGYTFKREFKYLGAYNEKQCFSISEVKEILTVTYKDDKILVSAKYGFQELNFNILNNINIIITKNADEIKKLGKQIFILENQFKTTFIKSSKYGVEKKRYFKIIDPNITSSEQLAKILNTKTWEESTNIIKPEN